MIPKQSNRVKVCRFQDMDFTQLIESKQNEIESIMHDSYANKLESRHTHNPIFPYDTFTQMKGLYSVPPISFILIYIVEVFILVHTIPFMSF